MDMTHCLSNFNAMRSVARKAIIESQSASAASLQRRLKIGYQEAQELLNLFEGELVSPVGQDGYRVILPQLLALTHVNHPTNTYWVIPGLLMAGTYPGTLGAEKNRYKLDRLLDCGITAFLDLTEADECNAYGSVLKTAAALRKLDCVYQRIPIQNASVPHGPHQMKSILQQISDWLGEKRTVYVHGKGGVGRTGTVVGCYLVQQGMNGQAALNHLRLLWTRMSRTKQIRNPISPEITIQCDYVRAWSPEFVADTPEVHLEGVATRV